MTDQKMVSGKWVEGLFNRALGPSIDAELSKLLEAEGLELKRPMQAKYPRDLFVRWVTLSARELFPGTEQPQALRLLGAKVVEDMRAAGDIRGAVLTMARLMGPRRVLRQLAEYVQGQSSLRVKLEERSKTDVRLELNDGELADFLAGSLEVILGLVGARSATVETRCEAPDRSVLSLRWA
ncbi:MAG: DUF2378 family protein [Archangiaceae bacterium]|nr:DUF2378 family protein [Archangiaceae bacterium]